MISADAASAQTERKIAIAANVLYLTNLLILPVISFVLLLVMQQRLSVGTLARNHIRHSIIASIAAGILLAICSVIFGWLGGWDNPYTWVFVIIYFLTCHASMVLLGVYTLAKAINSESLAWQ